MAKLTQALTRRVTQPLILPLNAAERRVGGLDPLPGYDADAQAFFDRLSSQPDDTRKGHYNTFVTALKSGGVWSKLDALYLFAAADQATALTSLISATYNATAVNAPTFTTDQGFTGASTKSVNTNFNPSTAGGKFTRNDANIFAWSLTEAVTPGASFGYLSLFDTSLFPRYTGDTRYVNLNNSIGGNVASSDGRGLLAGTRVDANGRDSYLNGAKLATISGASTALPNETFRFLVSNGLTFTGGQCAGGGFGSSLNAGEELALYNAMLAYLQAVGAV